MKRLLVTLFFIAAAVTLTVAQSPVNATDIIDQINRGETVQYNNVEIEGVLDLTNLDNRRKTESSGGWFGIGNSNDTYESHVEVSLSFTNCTFRDDVLAYYHDEGEEDTFIAHFDENVRFTGCTFEQASEFKYTEFSEEADFEKAIFQEDANFKYSKFEAPLNLNNVSFNGSEDFKYTEVDGEEFTTFLLKNQ